MSRCLSSLEDGTVKRLVSEKHVGVGPTQRQRSSFLVNMSHIEDFHAGRRLVPRENILFCKVVAFVVKGLHYQKCHFSFVLITSRAPDSFSCFNTFKIHLPAQSQLYHLIIFHLKLF